MPRSLLLWGMSLKEIDFLLDLTNERLLRKLRRSIDLPQSGRQQIDAYALVWDWYDHLLSYRHGAGEDAIKANWEACMSEEGITASEALVRLVYVYAERAERVGLDLQDSDVTFAVAQKRQAAWRNRKVLRQSSNG